MSNHRFLSLAFVSVCLLPALPVHAEESLTPATATVSAPLSAPAPLLSAGELQPLIGQAHVRILDIRAPQAYAGGHIPGAINTPYGQYRGPADNPGQLPQASALTAVLQKAGIHQDSHVIVVHGGTDHTDFGAAARVYWTLKVGGLTRLSIVDGGTRAWHAAGGELTTETPLVLPSQFVYQYDKDQIVTRDELAAAIQTGSAPRLIDSRPPAFFNGDVKPATAARYGTLPGAHSFNNAQFFPEGGTTLKPVDELKALVAQAGAAEGPAVSFCNTGHWAATNWFVMSEIAGNTAVKMYPDSMVDWSRSELPMENQPSRVEALLQDLKHALNK
ncbi:sulfurtransferase [Pseudomonas sp. B392_1p]|uniref:sulfurtransferase n=1 Tax=Pseudomonas sp. B392_1p TaxID=3457507 RepID=UPI003FD61D6E